MSALASTLLSISIFLLAAALLYIGRSIAKCVHLNKIHAYQAAAAATAAQEPLAPDAVRNQAVTVWVAIYTQSTTLHNDITKFISTAILAALGVAVTLAASKIIYLANPLDAFKNLISPLFDGTLKWTSTDGTIGVTVLLFALLWILGPAELLAYKQRDSADDIADQLNKGQLHSVFLPKCRLPIKHFVYQLIPFLLLILGVIFLFLAVSNSPLRGIP